MTNGGGQHEGWETRDTEKNEEAIATRNPKKATETREAKAKSEQADREAKGAEER